MTDDEPGEAWLTALQELYLARGRPRLRPLGTQAGMSYQTVNEYLHGARKPPLDKLLRLVKPSAAIRRCSPTCGTASAPRYPDHPDRARATGRHPGRAARHPSGHRTGR
jgi:hypothetical protein